MPDQAAQELFDVLTRVMLDSQDPEILKLAARSMARHPDAEGRVILRALLANRQLLGRLDQVTSPGDATRRLSRVFEALRERPDASVRDLCLALARDPHFVSIDDRNIFLLVTLAEVRPMDAATVEYFERINPTGYAAINAPLLVHNGSPRALALFERMIADTEIEPEDHVDSLRCGVLPNRTRLPIVEMCARLLGAGLPQDVGVGVVESLYDHRSKQWFGPSMDPPTPPPWRDGPSDVLLRLVALAPTARTAPGVSPELAAQVTATESELRGLVEERGR